MTATAPTTGVQPVLTVEHLNVQFVTDEGTYPAVNDSSFEIRPGEVLALVGESGSGKSVTSLAILGLLPGTARVTGRITLAGESLLDAGEARMNVIRGASVSMLFQEPMTALNPTMTVGAQVMEVLTNHRICSKAEAAKRAVELLGRVGIPDPERRAKGYPHELSGGQRQRVVIAIALACEPKLIVADEPTTALDVTVQAEILDLLRKLARESATAFLLITHNMGVVADIADHVAVMYNGDIVESGPMKQVLLEPAADYSQRLIAAIPKMPAAHWDDIVTAAQEGTVTVPAVPASLPADDVRPALQFDNASIDYVRGGRAFRAAHNITLTIPEKEIVGLVGESGSGKSTLGRCALGLIPAAEGTVTVLGHPVHARSLLSAEDKAVRRQIGVIFQDPGSSLDPRMTIAQCIEEPLLVHSPEGLSGRQARQARVAELLDAVELPSHYAMRYPHELSGGQRQRVGLARAIVLNPRVLIADEPTSALDVSVQAHVLDALRSLQAAYGFACLFISHDLAVVNEMSHRVAVMWQGHLVEVGETASLMVRPQHPYTIRLLAAVPSPDPREQARRREARRKLATLDDMATLADGAPPA
ncbi:MAG: ABC transporter ATP-binding protein [Propionibacteriaceae bacterium]|jgi:peptide/nickel transport system ATP-binding protein|nr:ABC transporter ATP-binding protein [Propionibacteriaceae bacterium]